MRAISANERKLIASLQQTKHRRSEGLFVVEGTRAVCDTLGLFGAGTLVVTQAWVDVHGNDIKHFNGEVLTASAADMQRMSGMKAPQGVLAVYRIPKAENDENFYQDKLVLALDCVQDPGNLGTIIRLADWFGIDTIYASTDTADAFNPKVVQATMGALARVRVVYCNLPEILNRAVREGISVYGTFLNGENIYDASLQRGGLIVMGNEGNGISPEVAEIVNSRLLIPSFPPGRQKVESLNVATATAITLSEFRRRGLN